MSSQGSGRINFLYTNIGRGHPHYLDGIVGRLAPERLGRTVDIFAVTSGLGRAAWRTARAVYLNGGRGGWRSTLYNRLRTGGDYNKAGPLQRVMGRALQRAYLKDPEPLVVGHPLLAAILKGKTNLFFQHGELAAPRECWVRGGHRVFVPLPETADAFIAAGLDPARLHVSGLCIESELVARAESALSGRLARLGASGSLCGGYFSSGAEPRGHVRSLAAAAVSAVEAGGHAVIVASRSGLFADQVVRHLGGDDRDLQVTVDPHDLPARLPRALLCLYDDRRELNEYTVRLFERFDYFVAPAHERSHWALGLGLPMFAIEPVIGSYAAANRDHLLAASVAEVIPDMAAAARFGERLATLQRLGALQAMAESGWGRFDPHGFDNIAVVLQSI